jgi:Zn-dependent M28 family amino/carboxypeptidase
MVAALVAAETSDERTGYIFTGAEEFGLVGARILAQQTSALVRGLDVINLDTIDDTGTVAIVAHDRRGAELAKRLASVLQAPGFRIRRRHLPPGILVDSVALARAGARAVTVARLDWGTLRSIHTSRDSFEALALTTARQIGAGLASLR